MTVNDRGSLPAKVVQAYAAAHAEKGSTVARTARKSTSRGAAKKTTSLPRARKAAKKTARRGAPARKAAPRAAAAPRATATAVDAPPPGKIDLAGALRSHLAAIDAEVRAVNALTERIDTLVTELNDVRDQQAKRLIVLDELRSSVSDQSLGSFLDKVIASRKPRVPEVIPDRLA
jgi:hypothetical protein